MLLCQVCGGQMRITSVHHTQCRYPANTGVHRGGLRAASNHPGTRAAVVERGDASENVGVEVWPDCDEAAQPAPNHEVAQCVSWGTKKNSGFDPLQDALRMQHAQTL